MVALLAYWVAWLLNTYLTPLIIGNGVIISYIIEIAANVIGAIAGVYAACKVAPKGKKVVAIVVASLFILIALSSLVVSFVYHSYTVKSIIAAIAMIGASIYAICESDIFY